MYLNKSRIEIRDFAAKSRIAFFLKTIFSKIKIKCIHTVAQNKIAPLARPIKVLISAVL